MTRASDIKDKDDECKRVRGGQARATSRMYKEVECKLEDMAPVLQGQGVQVRATLRTRRSNTTLRMRMAIASNLEDEEVKCDLQDAAP